MYTDMERADGDGTREKITLILERHVTLAYTALLFYLDFGYEKELSPNLRIKRKE